MTRRRVLHNVAGVTAPGVLTVLCLFGFVVGYVLTVRTTPGRQLGHASLRGALITNSGVVDAVDAILGVVSVATLLGGVAAITLIAVVRQRRVPGLTAVGLLIAANASTWLLKTHLLTRPDLGLREITPATQQPAQRTYSGDVLGRACRAGRRSSAGAPRRWLIAMTAGSAGVGFCLAFGLVLIAALRSSTAGAVLAFVAGGVLIVAAVAVLMAELGVLQRTDRATLRDR